MTTPNVPVPTMAVRLLIEMQEKDPLKAVEAFQKMIFEHGLGLWTYRVDNLQTGKTVYIQRGKHVSLEPMTDEELLDSIGPEYARVLGLLDDDEYDDEDEDDDSLGRAGNIPAEDEDEDEDEEDEDEDEDEDEEDDTYLGGTEEEDDDRIRRE